MSMLTAQKAVVQATFFSTKRLGEELLYNKKTIVAVVEVGADMTRTDWNDARTKVEEADLGDFATFFVLDSDVAEPQEGDVIVYKDTTYNVTQIIDHDVFGGNYQLLAMKNGRAFGR
jgi:hypothetical protein